MSENGNDEQIPTAVPEEIRRPRSGIPVIQQRRNRKVRCRLSRGGSPEQASGPSATTMHQGSVFTGNGLWKSSSSDEFSKNLAIAYGKSLAMSSNVGGQGSIFAVEMACDGYPELWTNMRKDTELCDCHLQSSDGKCFPVHRVVMASSSPYFRTLFKKSPLPDSFWESGDPHKVPVRNVDRQSLECLIDFAYTGNFTKSLEIIDKLLPIAERFGVKGIVQQSCAFLLKSMTPDNCLRIYRMAKKYFCEDLNTKAQQFILHQFRAITRTRDFLALSAREVHDIFSDDHLNARNEAMVFEAIRSWVEHDPRNRKERVAELLHCVRFGLMSYGYFTNVVFQWKYVAEDDNVKRTLYAASMFLAATDSLNNSEVDLNDPLARPRIPHEVVFAVGGWSAGSPTSFMETYDVRADRWFLSNNPDTTPRAYHGLVALGHSIYMIGGFDGNEHFNTVRKFDAVLKVWEEKSCMYFARCYVSCCEMDGKIYACGGYNGRTRMASVERYDPDTNQWDVIQPMNRQRSDASACSLKGKVYVAGGFTGTEVLNSVECYDPQDGQWTFIQPMNTARSGVALVSYRDCLYAIGGFNGFIRLNTGERFNPELPTVEWQLIPEMSSARSNFAAVCADELLVCIGGFNGATTIPYVECYDSKVNEWFDASHMNLNRSALSACVLSSLPNAKEYSYLYRIQELLGLTDGRI